MLTVAKVADKGTRSVEHWWNDTDRRGAASFTTQVLGFESGPMHERSRHRRHLKAQTAKLIEK
jgi:hypothetical protein